MRSQTRGATIAADPESVFDYVARAENLPAWAPAFAQSLRAENDHWIATTATGEVAFRLRLDKEFGIVDFLVRVPSGAYVLAAPTRIASNPAGGAEYLFTLFQRPDEDDERFEERLRTLDGEFAALQRILGAAVLR